jgi:tRNA A37 methylthiotransferase MiaB
VPGISRVRVSYLQPAEVRPGLIDALTGTPGVVPYFDLSFQHAAPGLLRRMRRFGGTEEFLGLLEAVRDRNPRAGVRSNVIVGFPGETERDVAELEAFLQAARLDVVGVFGYSDEEGTEAAGMGGKLDVGEIAQRVERIGALVDELVAQRAEERIGESVEVLLEGVDPGGPPWGRAEHQGPDVDGVTRITGMIGGMPGRAVPQVGDLVRVSVLAGDGADLVAGMPPAAAGEGVA